MSLSNYSLNQRLNYILSLLQGIVPPVGGFVTINGNQTIGSGVKTFTNLPESSAIATTNDQFPNKLYVDNAVSGVPTPTLQQVVNTGNGISNFLVGSNASITSTNFTNNRQLLLNTDADPTIKMIDNLNSSHFTTFDIDTINLNGTSTNWSTIVSGSTPTIQQVLTAGNTATNSVTLNNTGTGTNVINLLPNASASNPQITLTDGTTTNTIDKNGYTTRNSVQNVTHYLNFSDSSATGTGAIQKTAGISCNPSTNTVTATTFVGAVTGTATNATNIAITKKTDSVEYPLVFTTTGTGNKPLYTGTGSLVDNPTYNPSTNTLSIQDTNNNSVKILYNQINLLSTGNNGSTTMNGLRVSATETTTANTCSLEKTGQVKTSVNNNTYPATSSSSNLYLINRSATAGATSGVPSIVFDAKSGRNTIAGDVIGSQNYFALNYAGTFTEFARVEASVRNTGVGNDDGSIAFSGLINGTMTEFFRVNGADSENNMFLPLDMNGQAIKSSSGNLAFSSTGSSGGGVISLTSKTQSPTSQPDFIITNNVTNTLTHSVSAGWDFQANNMTTTGNITCNTLNYTTLNPPISGTTTTYAGVTNISASLTTLTGTTPYGRIYTSTFGGTATVKLPVLGTSPLKTITFTLCGVGPGNDIALQTSAGVGITTLVGGLTTVSYTFVDNTTSWIWL